MSSRIFHLNQFDLISFTGPDSRKFLQGQVSCNIDLLSSQLSQRGAVCNLKGRVVADFRIIAQTGDGDDKDSCLMQLSPGLGATVKSVLDKYAVFSKVDITLRTDRFRRLGLLGQDAEEIVRDLFGDCPGEADRVISSEDGFAVRLPGLEPRFEIWQSLAPASPTPTQIDFRSLVQLSQGSDEEWAMQDISQGIVHISPGTSEQYTPQLLNYDISGVIDFKKGCYTGQEVVARMFYRGNAKKRLFRASVETGPVSPTTTVIIDADTTPQEPILSFAHNSQGGYELLAILPINSIENDRLMTLSNEQHSPLRILTLPYTE